MGRHDGNCAGAAEGGDAPDLFEVYDENMYNVILSGVVSPLDDLTTDADYSYYDVDKSLFSWKGSVYAIPLKPYTFYIMFNRELFELEGLKAPDELFRKEIGTGLLLKSHA